MKRDIEKQLEEWKNSPRHKPLIINGARQVGKTYSLKSFGEKFYKNVVYLNFEKDEKIHTFFQETLEPKKLLKFFELHKGVFIEPHHTLVIFDEIQECGKAVNSLKYFCEEANEYHIVAAGSLLGIKTKKEKGFPVGKVNFITMHPLTFFEFLSAMKEEEIRRFLEEYAHFEPFPEAIHEKILQLLKIYLFTGGMPEVLYHFSKNENFDTVREIQLEILNSYERDFAKHAPSHDLMKIIAVWKQVHRQLAKENKKFIFAAIRHSARGRDYEEAIQWLLDAGLILKSTCVETPKFPLSAYANTHIFKLFLFDVGLLAAQNSLSSHVLVDGHLLFTEFKGSLTENFVAQELFSAKNKEIYYWTSSGNAEVDFLCEGDHHIFPLEVKAGNSLKKKSLITYGQKYPEAILSRSSLLNLKHDGKIYNFPLYFISRFYDLAGK